MKRFLSKLFNSSPKDLVQYIGRMISLRRRHPDRMKSQKRKGLSEELLRKFEVYKTQSLRGVSPDEFAKSIHSRIEDVDSQTEGYSEEEIERQRDFSIKFHWGHNHDFGDFKLEGPMGNRHINLLVDFIDFFPVSLSDFADKSVLDVGCWTGGTTLLLATIANKVCAIEEVKKYAQTASYLTKSFGVSDRVSVKPLSVYDCNASEFYDQFDIVFFPGVIYHLSDPLLALRILFNSMKTGGFILIESAGINVKEPLCRFEGSLVHHSGTRKRMNRGGWNWFVPSPLALHRLMREAGFDEIQTHWDHETRRLYAFGKKLSSVGICKAGLAVPSIR